MANLINKDELVSEIEKRIKEIDEIGTYLSQKGTLTNLLCFINALEVKEETEWNEQSTNPPFTSICDGNKYSDAVLCKDKMGEYCIAQYVRLHTGYRGWFSGEDEVTITYWKELK